MSKPRIVPEWCFIHLFQNIEQIKAVFFTVWKITVNNKWTQDVFKTQIWTLHYSTNYVILLKYLRASNSFWLHIYFVCQFVCTEKNLHTHLLHCMRYNRQQWCYIKWKTKIPIEIQNATTVETDTIEAHMHYCLFS